tara:strand:+ start:172 stop:456 length:285 start_codon:yes stop_codon:yes gene_type:complete
MSIVGAALRGFGKALGRGSKNKAKKKFDAKRKAFKGASEKNKFDQDVKKTVKGVKKASERAEKFSRTLMKQNYSDSAVNKNLTASYKKMMKKKD